MKSLILLLSFIFSFSVFAQNDIPRRTPGPIQPIPSDGGNGGSGTQGYDEVQSVEVVSGAQFQAPVSNFEYRMVESDSGERLLSGENCFGSGPFTGGQTVTLTGTSNIDYVELNYSDTVNGCIINGTMELTRFRSATFVYNSILSRWIEIHRNF